MPANSIACHTCSQVYLDKPLTPGSKAKCERCGSTVAKRTRSSLHFTGAFSLTALLLYGPANVFPILKMHMYGATSENTIWQGCVRFYNGGDYFVAVIVFLASIFIPLLKLLGLFFLVISSQFNVTRWKVARTYVYRTIELLGRWAMLDVFMLAVLVSLVKLQQLARIEAGPGALAFTLLVVFTTLASQSFDPELIWNSGESKT